MKLREILLVGGILVLLAVTLFFVFRGQQETATSIAAMRNLQQWGIALNLYLIDHDNQLPLVGSTPIEEASEGAWFNALPPYLSRPPLSKLAPGSRPRPGVASLWISPYSKPVRAWDEREFFFNYAMNQFLQPDPAERSFKINELGLPGKVIFLGETAGFSPALTPENVQTDWGRRSSLDPRALAHILFCDGHVDLVSRETLVNDPLTLSLGATEEGGITWFKE